MNVASISERTFYRHTSSYVNPVVIQQWREHQQQLLDSLADKEDGLVLAGDGRCDSPGYCAKYGSYTLIEEEMNRVVDFELVQVGVETPLLPPPHPPNTHTHHHHHHHPTFTVISVSVSLPFSVQFCFFSRAMRSGIVPGWSTKDW